MARIWLSDLVGAFQVVLLLKNMPVNAGDIRDMGLIPGLERTSGGGSLSMQETRVRSLDWGDSMEKEMATHCSILAWRIPWTEEPMGLPKSWT